MFAQHPNKVHTIASKTFIVESKLQSKFNYHNNNNNNGKNWTLRRIWGNSSYWEFLLYSLSLCVSIIYSGIILKYLFCRFGFHQDAIYWAQTNYRMAMECLHWKLTEFGIQLTQHCRTCGVRGPHQIYKRFIFIKIPICCLLQSRAPWALHLCQIECFHSKW